MYEREPPFWPPRTTMLEKFIVAVLVLVVLTEVAKWIITHVG